MSDNNSDRFASLKVEERVLALTTIDAKICAQLKQMVEKSKQTFNSPISNDQLCNLAFKIISLPKPQQEYQFEVTHSDTKHKSLATPTHFIDLAPDINK